MARQVLAAGHPLAVCDARPEAAAPLLEAGATFCDSPAQLAADCEVVFTSLPGPPQLDAVSALLCERPRPGLVHVDLSTISLPAARRVQEAEARAGIAFLDCPVSGGAVLAARGKLTLMASGERAAFEKVEPILRAIGERIFYLGEQTGTGTLFKLVNNAIFLCAGQLAQEGLVLAAKAGLDLDQLLDTLKVSSSAMFLGMAQTTLARGFDAEGFSLALADKDIGLALETACALGVPMPTTAAARETYAKALAEGRGDKLFTATLETLEAAAEVVVPGLAGR